MIRKFSDDPRVKEAAAIAETYSIDPRTYLDAPVVDRMLLLAALRATNEAHKKAADEAKRTSGRGAKRRR